MAGYLTAQQLINGSLDAETLERYATGSAGQPNVNRVGNDVKNLATLTQQVLEVASGAAKLRTYLTAAAMNSDTSSPAGTTGQVTNDSDASKNGYYVFNGMAWLWSGIQPASVPRVNSLLRVVQACPWLDPSVLNLSGSGQTDWFLPTQKRIEAALAIKSVRIENGDPNEQYIISVICNQDPTNKDRIAIAKLSDGTTVLNTGAVDIARNASGLTRVVIGSVANDASLRAYLDIDYREITSTGILNSASSGLFRIARTRELDAIRQIVDRGMLPSWLRADYRNLVLAGNERWRAATSAIRGIWLDGVDSAKDYRVSVLAKDQPYGNRILIHDGVGTVAGYEDPGIAPTGIQTVPLSERNGSGVSGTLTINWSLLTGPFVVTSAVSNLVIDPNYPDPERAAQLVYRGGGSNSEASLRPLARAIKVALAGSSINWGQGYLGELSYVGAIEWYLRTQAATSIHASVLAPSAASIVAPNLWLGSARRLQGVNASAEFDLWGDELTVNLCRERGSDGAALVDVYVDDVLFDTFSTYNGEPFGTDTENFTGNGTDLKYPLSRAFTCGHVVTVNGTELVGGMNTQGSGAAIPAGWDYLITRAYSVPLNAVVHQIWFRNAPTGPIACSYSYGESISYMRGTLGNIGKGLDTPLESPFGDGAVSEDTTQPASVSSGLGFRDSDPRACVTYMLGEAKQRHFRLVVRALDPRATGGTPWLDLNFVTNRMHHIMNAGIGGWSAELFLTSEILLNRIDRVAEWGPDVFLLESCTNDDWLTHVTKGWVTRTGVTAQQLKDDESSNYFSSITGTSPNKTVLDDRIPISAAAAKAITLNTAGATISAAPGDALVIGSFHGDHRRVAVRLIDTYAAGVATFKRPINADDFAQADDLAGLVGEWAMIKAAPTWVSQVEQCVQIVQDENPDCRVHVATCGAPNYHHRRLFGYRELGMDLARTKGWGFVDFYDATNRFQYNQPQTGRLYITTSQGTTSTGAASYPLYMPNGSVPTARMIHMPRILVDGVDRTNKGVHIEGGYAYSWASGVAEPSLSNDTLQQKPYRLAFTSNVPAAGAVIEVSYATRIWSTDDTHPGRLDLGVYGIAVFGSIGQQIVDAQTIGIL
ncbi:hypothetical protein [Achromobacter insolitus]|uniref:hypothetical protein n=2 Tax=Pseudomonadota TaxID=1224 RepID=UPI00366AC3E3